MTLAQQLQIVKGGGWNALGTVVYPRKYSHDHPQVFGKEFSFFFSLFFFVRLLFRSHFCTLLICIHLYTHHWIEH
ncbi:hypothetical protein BDQ94DRAFT_152664 [Aspergillus welwitschiae]|uniref:Uncharacterized protein n=1 Tax=Aspergillus welwitschiae TaxID=1341132 RepID=A0A3F3PMV7_9EURO|nr:hypothetical protein BDQ94DRAFT_152664 [Aspergillus welwitschiae]RDH28158.1 hypothetical protein BDQ94DRAFT_152664 [Aspergillus welwitschiae]